MSWAKSDSTHKQTKRGQGMLFLPVYIFRKSVESWEIPHFEVEYDAYFRWKLESMENRKGQ